MYQFTPKRPNEQEVFGFDFTPQLSTGESISTATVTASVISGSDPSPQSIVSGAAVISKGKVSQKIIGGVDGEIYKLVCQVSTTGALFPQVLEAVGSLQITDANV